MPSDPIYSYTKTLQKFLATIGIILAGLILYTDNTFYTLDIVSFVFGCLMVIIIFGLGWPYSCTKEIIR